MKPFIRPLDNSLVMFGRACTGLHMNTYAVAEGEKPFEIEIALVDDLKPGDVARQRIKGYDIPRITLIRRNLDMS
jgi:hypothetical protein